MAERMMVLLRGRLMYLNLAGDTVKETQRRKLGVLYASQTGKMISM